jgi:hypothetical protein
MSIRKFSGDVFEGYGDRNVLLVNDLVQLKI